jgi:hypothetical protein
VVSDGGRIVGIVSITPPGGPDCSIDKYFKRGRLQEMKALTTRSLPQE